MAIRPNKRNCSIGFKQRLNLWDASKLIVHNVLFYNGRLVATLVLGGSGAKPVSGVASPLSGTRRRYSAATVSLYGSSPSAFSLFATSPGDPDPRAISA